MEHRKKKEIVAEYRYLKAVKLRFDDKSFCWKHWEDDRLVQGKGGVPHALYHAELLEHAETVFLAEGEKDADTICVMGLTGVCTEDGASQNAQKPKWYPEYEQQLRGKTVVVLNDNDPPGIAHAEACANRLLSVAAEVKRIPMDSLWPEVPEKGDISDMAAALGLEQTRALLLQAQEAAPLWISTEYLDNPVWKALDMEPLQIPDRWNLQETGVGMLRDREGSKKYYRTISSTPVVPVAIYQNMDTGEQEVRLRALIREKPVEFTVPRKLLSANQKLVEALSSRGVDVITATAGDMVSYFRELLCDNHTIPMYTSVNHLGWVGRDFLPYTCEHGVRFASEDIDRATFEALVVEKGTLQEWVEFVTPLRRKPVIRLLMAASFASPLIGLLSAQPFIFELWGTTGFGKTMALRLAMSVWGNAMDDGLVFTMDNTITAMCITAYVLQNLPLAADELQLIKQSCDGSYDRFIMTFCEGKERGRANQKAEKQKQRTWKSCALVTGEEPLTESGAGAGSRNRTIEIKCMQPLFDDPAGVVEFIGEHYGTAGRAFIRQVQNMKRADLQQRCQTLRRSLDGLNVTDKQQAAAALCMLADEIARMVLFPEEAPLTADDLLPFLKTEKEVKASAHAKDFICDWIAANIGHFPKAQGDSGTLTVDEPNGVLYGAVAGNDRIIINYTQLAAVLRNEGYSIKAVADDWMEEGFLKRFYLGASGGECCWRKQIRTRVRSFSGGTVVTRESHPRCCILQMNPDWTDQADNAAYVGKMDDPETEESSLSQPVAEQSQISEAETQLEILEKCS